MPNVLVLDAQKRNSLAVIRSLGKKGLKVDAGDEARFATGFFSRFCRNRFTYPDPIKFEEKFINSILTILKKNNYEMIFPVSDRTVLPIIKHKAEISEYAIVPYPDYNTISKAMFKDETIKVAISNGVPIPKTIFIHDISDIDSSDLTYPVIIKPIRSSGSLGFSICRTEQELYQKFPINVKKYGCSLIQEYIPSNGEIGVYTLFNSSSNPVALSVQKRLRSYPISGGPSTLRETILNEELVSISFKLLKAMRWIGLAMVEFRIDSRDGTPKLMEINPRFWGSLQLSIFAGVDFPYVLYKMFKGDHIESDLNYKIGTRCRWILPGDILWYLNSPNKIQNFKEFSRLDIQDDIIALDDIGPTFGFFLSALCLSFNVNIWKFLLRK